MRWFKFFMLAAITVALFTTTSVDGQALGYSVHIAANDRNRPCGDGRLGDGCLPDLPALLVGFSGAEAVWLIDVLRLRDDDVVAAFEVEHSTSIYSGIIHLLDLSQGAPSDLTRELFIVTPNGNKRYRLRCVAQLSAVCQTCACAICLMGNWSGIASASRALVRG